MKKCMHVTKQSSSNSKATFNIQTLERAPFTQTLKTQNVEYTRANRCSRIILYLVLTHDSSKRFTHYSTNIWFVFVQIFFIQLVSDNALLSRSAVDTNKSDRSVIVTDILTYKWSGGDFYVILKDFANLMYTDRGFYSFFFYFFFLSLLSSVLVFLCVIFCLLGFFSSLFFNGCYQ